MALEVAPRDEAVPIEMEIDDGVVTMEIEPVTYHEPRAPRVLQPLKNADVFEGMR